MLITSPVEARILPYGETLVLEADVLDDEDGVLADAAVVWTSDLDGELGTGARLEVSDLSFGTHTLTATVTDSGGLGALDTVQVQVSQHHTVASWMTGHFSSAQQSVEDPSYYDITLHMARIWHARTDGVWIYVEQSVTGSDPYRQRVYRLFEQDGLVQDEIYELPNAAGFIGAWATPEIFDGQQPSSLNLKGGCEVYFTWMGEDFEGGTEGTACPSSLNGASYATTEIALSDGLLTSWDIGWTDQDVQVWGPTDGPYLFDKLEDYPLD